MIVSDAWKEYQLLDAGRGMKLERWGGYILERPDPQAIWDAPSWSGQHGIYHRSHQGGGHWEFRSKIPRNWTISYPSKAGTLKFMVEPTGFKHTGIFPEQGANWDFIIQKLKAAKDDGENPRVLNLFAYTGAATVAAAAGGAEETVHIDASKGMNQRAKENLALSGLDDKKVRILADDVMKFVAREQRRGRSYTGIIMDPPSYGRGPGGEVWQLESQLWKLLEAIVPLIDPVSKHAFFILNAYTTGLAAAVLSNCVQLCLPRGEAVMADEIGLRAERRPLILPCGSTCRWQRTVDLR